MDVFNPQPVPFTDFETVFEQENVVSRLDGAKFYNGSIRVSASIDYRIVDELTHIWVGIVVNCGCAATTRVHIALCIGR